MPLVRSREQIALLRRLRAMLAANRELVRAVERYHVKMVRLAAAEAPRRRSD